MTEQNKAEPIDPQLFRRVLGHFAAGVTVVTTVDAHGIPRGMTATAFSSVSLDPPLVLVCVEKRAYFSEAISAASHFCVNFLAAHQEHLSQRFASREQDKFAGLEQRQSSHGVPLLTETLGFVECAQHEIFAGGDHLIVVGRIVQLEVTGGEPLIHFAGKYRFLQGLDSATT